MLDIGIKVNNGWLMGAGAMEGYIHQYSIAFLNVILLVGGKD